jgi:hypothetical protein
MRELDEKSAEGGYSAANSMEHKEFSVRRGSVFPQIPTAALKNGGRFPICSEPIPVGIAAVMKGASCRR